MTAARRGRGECGELIALDAVHTAILWLLQGAPAPCGREMATSYEAGDLYVTTTDSAGAVHHAFRIDVIPVAHPPRPEG